jgi:cell filamentation protein, protein adenylyltransferase
VLKRCVTARTALAELRLAGHLIPDQSVLVHAIPNLEARASSAVENIVTTNDALFREASLGDQEAEPATKEAARYRNALYAAIDVIKTRPLSTRIAVELCRAITGIDLDIRRTPGTTLRNSHTGEVIYTPPEGEERLRELLSNWERFAHESPDLDPLVRMAVLHYQFEAIHPFPDGNGRTGRILNILSLMQDGLLDLPTLYLSRYILKTRGEYYRRLGEVTFEQQWEPWVIYVLAGVEETSMWTTQKIRAIRALMDETTRYVRAAAPKLPHVLIEQIFTQPYCRIGNLVEHGVAERHTASAYLKELARLGVLEEEKVGRDKIFLHRKYLDVLFSDEHGFDPYPKPATPVSTKRRTAEART